MEAEAGAMPLLALELEEGATTEEGRGHGLRTQSHKSNPQLSDTIATSGSSGYLQPLYKLATKWGFPRHPLLRFSDLLE